MAKLDALGALASDDADKLIALTEASSKVYLMSSH